MHQFKMEYNHEDKDKENISIGSNILPNSGLLFATIQPNPLVLAENSVLFINFNSFFQLNVGILFIRSKNHSGVLTFNGCLFPFNLFPLSDNVSIHYLIHCNAYLYIAIWCKFLCYDFDCILLVLFIRNVSENSTNLEIDQSFGRFH